MELPKVTQEAESDFSNYANGEERRLYIARMREEGKIVKIPANNELFIDIDSEQHYAVYQRALLILRNNFGDTLDYTATETLSSSGYPHRHIVITLDREISTEMRIAFQAALGSDPVRELISLIRYMKGDVFPTLFVETP